MKILFSEYSFGSEQGNKWFNSGIAALSASMKAQGDVMHLLKFSAGAAESDFEKGLEAIRPDLVAFSTMSFQWGMTSHYAGVVKRSRPDVPIVCGGYHSTFHTEAVMSCPHVD